VAWADGVAIADGGGVRTAEAGGAETVGHGLGADDDVGVPAGDVADALGNEGEMEPSAAGPQPATTSAAASASLPMQPRITDRRSVI